MAVWAISSPGLAETAPTNRLMNLDFGDSSPAIGSNGTIYLGTFHEKLWAVNPRGVALWTFKTGSEIRSSPAIGADGTIYFGCRDRKFYAVSPAGKMKWAYTTGGWVDSSPAVAREGTVYFGSWDRHFYALNPDGTVKWRFATDGEIDSSPAVGADGTVYFGSHDKRFYALAPDGKKRWEYVTGGQIISSPALDGEGGVYFTSVDGFFHALNEDGTLRWQLRTGGCTRSSPVIGTDGTIYVGVNNSAWAIHPAGTNLWIEPMSGSVEAAPVVVADAVYVFDRAEVRALDAEGRFRWRIYLWTFFDPTSAVGADGTMYVAGSFNRLNALDTQAPLARTPWPKFRGNPRNTGDVRDQLN